MWHSDYGDKMAEEAARVQSELGGVLSENLEVHVRLGNLQSHFRLRRSDWAQERWRYIVVIALLSRCKPCTVNVFLVRNS